MIFLDFSNDILRPTEALHIRALGLLGTRLAEGFRLEEEAAQLLPLLDQHLV